MERPRPTSSEALTPPCSDRPRRGPSGEAAGAAGADGRAGRGRGSPAGCGDGGEVGCQSPGQPDGARRTGTGRPRAPDTAAHVRAQGPVGARGRWDPRAGPRGRASDPRAVPVYSVSASGQKGRQRRRYREGREGEGAVPLPRRNPPAHMCKKSTSVFLLVNLTLPSGPTCWGEGEVVSSPHRPPLALLPLQFTERGAT